MDRNDERFVAGPEDFVRADELSSEPRSISELMIAGGHSCSSLEEARPFLRGMWDLATEAGTQLGTPHGIARALHEFEVISDDEYSTYLLLQQQNSAN